MGKFSSMDEVGRLLDRVKIIQPNESTRTAYELQDGDALRFDSAQDELIEALYFVRNQLAEATARLDEKRHQRNAAYWHEEAKEIKQELVQATARAEREEEWINEISLLEDAPADQAAPSAVEYVKRLKQSLAQSQARIKTLEDQCLDCVKTGGQMKIQVTIECSNELFRSLWEDLDSQHKGNGWTMLVDFNSIDDFDGDLELDQGRVLKVEEVKP